MTHTEQAFQLWLRDAHHAYCLTWLSTNYLECCEWARAEHPALWAQWEQHQAQLERALQ